MTSNGTVNRPECQKVSQVITDLNSNYETGLTTAAVSSAQEKYGWNELEKKEATSIFELILEQFDDVLVKILLAAAVISFLLAYFDDQDEGDAAYIEPLVILTILILNAIVGVWQESNAEKALEALKDLQPEFARCRRDGSWITLQARELVPGDIVQVRVGDKIPADIRMIDIKTSSLMIEQSQLTGESHSVEKEVDELPDSTESVIQAKNNILFAATTVVSGIGTGIVLTTGMNTEIGHIQQSVQEAEEEDESTPLKKKLDEFGEALSKVIGIVCLLVWLINYQNFFDPSHGSVFRGSIYYFKIAVALAVAAIPEGLPAVITTCLALGTRKMAKKNAIIRKLPSVETLGCTTVICSDKTGTLTTNEMSCVLVCHPSNSPDSLQDLEVKGHTYAPVGDIIGLKSLSSPTVALAQISALCNESAIEYKDGKYVRVGEPTEAALKVLVEKMGLPDDAKQAELMKGRETSPENYVSFCAEYWKSQFTTLATLEFNRNRKSMSVLCKPKDNTEGNVLLVKGAPEGVLERCSTIMLQNGNIVPLTEQARSIINKRFESMADDALRCLAFAVKKVTTGSLATYNGDRHHPAQQLLKQSDSFAEIESNMTFVGLAGLMDPPRPEVNPMVDICHKAGIRVIMITGDNKRTAEKIGMKIGLFSENESLDDKSFTGTDFFNLSEEKQSMYLNTDSSLIFSRAEPRHKQKLVRMLKKKGDVVAMTGDGVNDAPALKQADIGIAMGLTGTEVAKEASDMVLADDNFATIVSAVEEGRSIYNNTQAFIRYLISSNIGEVAAIFFTALLGFPDGLYSVQLLWVNLVTDGPPATALGFNPPDQYIMKKLPRRSDDVLITSWVFFRYMVIGIYVGFACVGVFAYWYMYFDSGDGHTLLTFDQLSHWTKCHEWEGFTVNNFDGMDFSDDPCKYFSEGKVAASTLSLSVLVVIEMLNALNALSEDNSLVTMPPWSNPYLLIAIVFSIGMHFVILYVDVLAQIFRVKPLDFNEWMLVFYFSVPVILLDEILKFFGRRILAKEMQSRRSSKKMQ